MPWPDHPTDQPVPSTYALMMLRDAEEEGTDLLAGMGVDLAEIEGEELIPASLSQRIIEAYTNWNDHPDWAFGFGQRLGIASHGPLGFGALAAPTVEEGLRFLARYIGVRAQQTSCDAIATHEGLRLVFKMGNGSGVNARTAETLAMVFQSYLRSVGAQVRPTLWLFPFPEPVHGAAYSRWIQGGYRFNAPQLCFEVPRSVLMLVSPSHDQTALRSCEYQCEALLAQTAGSLPRRVEQVLLGALRTRLMESVPVTPVPGIDEMAARFSVSRRTLIRHLQSAGTSYRELKDRLLANLIRQGLSTGMPIGDLAERLGYTDAGNFTRACRRLLGESPSRVRIQQAGVSLF